MCINFSSAKKYAKVEKDLAEKNTQTNKHTQNKNNKQNYHRIYKLYIDCVSANWQNKFGLKHNR